MKARWSPYEQSGNNSRRKCECRMSTKMQKWGHTSDMKYPYLFTACFSDWSKQEKVSSSRVTHRLFWNSSSELMSKLLLDMKDLFSAAQRYFLLQGLQPFQALTTWPCQLLFRAPVVDIDKSAASAVLGQYRGKGSPRKHGSQRQPQYQPHQETAPCFALQSRSSTASAIPMWHKVSLHQILN